MVSQLHLLFINLHQVQKKLDLIQTERQISRRKWNDYKSELPKFLFVAWSLTLFLHATNARIIFLTLFVGNSAENSSSLGRRFRSPINTTKNRFICFVWKTVYSACWLPKRYACEILVDPFYWLGLHARLPRRPLRCAGDSQDAAIITVSVTTSGELAL